MTLHFAVFFTSRSTGVDSPCSRRSVAASGRAVVMFLLTMTVGAAFAIAQGDDEEADVVIAVVERQNRFDLVAERQIVLTEQQFDQMMFGGRAEQQVQVVVNGVIQRIEVVGQQAMDDARKRMDDFRTRMEFAMGIEIQELDAYFSWTEAQKKKLRLAARGDILRYFDRVRELRQRCTPKPMTQQKYTALRLDMQRLRINQPNQLFGEPSLFRKTLRGVLTAEQSARFRAFERQQHAKIIENVLANWDRLPNTVRLSGDSRKKFIDVLVEHGHLPLTAGSYIQYVVLLETDRLEDRVQAVLTEEEWDKLKLQVTQSKRYEAAVRNAGEWPLTEQDDDDETTTDAKKD